MTSDPALELLGIEKRFGSVMALGGADFVLGRGEVHGLLGENGAGKSTLMHVAFGLVQPDRGLLRVAGREVRLRGPRMAKTLGIGMVHQHFTSIVGLSVRENLWLAAGRLGSAAGAPPAESTESAGGRFRAKLWEGLDPGRLVEELSVGAKQRLELLQAMATGAEILLLDEPTAVLAPSETEVLLALLREFAASGGSVVFITHKLDEVLGVADRVTVMRRGKVTWTGAAADQTRQSLTRAMVGDAAALPARQKRGEAGRVVIKTASIEVRAGEMIGVAAVEGNGQRQLLRSLAGLVSGSEPATMTGSVAFIPEDRTTEGLAPGFTLTENLVLGLPSDPRWSRGVWLDWNVARGRTLEMIAEYGIRTGGPDSLVRTMSGGNQQKLVIARAVESAAAVVVAENPTRGLDVQATADVHERLRALTQTGTAVLVYSADLDEVLELADRVVVMYRGRVRQVPQGTSRSEIGAMMIGGWD